MTYRVELDIFEGPLDLLLYLIKKNEVDIYDIPVAQITEQYLEYLDLMRAFNLNLAGEFLLMASTLMYIKSRMLLPDEGEEEEGEEGIDPREELVQRLIEYRRFKEAAEDLGGREQLDRDFFTRTAAPPPEDEELEEGSIGEVSLIQLIEALRTVLSHFPEEAIHEVTLEGISIKERIGEIAEALQQGEGAMEFAALFAQCQSRREAIVTFLTLLEMVKLQMVRIYQTKALGPIRIKQVGPSLEEAGQKIKEEGKEQGEGASGTK